MAIVFGKSGMSMPTPSGVSNGLNITAAVCGALVSWVTTVSFIPSNVSNIIASILGLIITLSLTLKPFFGVSGMPAKVPLEDVTGVDESAAKP